MITETLSTLNIHKLTKEQLENAMLESDFDESAFYMVQDTIDKELILASSTEGSLKKFKITVDDSGTLSATEVVE